MLTPYVLSLILYIVISCMLQIKFDILNIFVLTDKNVFAVLTQQMKGPVLEQLVQAVPTHR